MALGYWPIGYGFGAAGVDPSPSATGGYMPIGYGYHGAGLLPAGGGGGTVDPSAAASITSGTPRFSPFSPSLGVVLYCTDEDIACRCPGDFYNLCPEWQCVGKGVDGVFASGDPWVLRSASVDFLAVGVGSGHVVVLSGPKSVFRNGGELFGVDAVTSGRVRLRRIGQPSGFGMPPAPIAGLTGVSFEIKTLAPQILDMSLDANNTFGIDVNVPLNNPASIYDPNRQLLRYTVLGVLLRQYTNQNREGKGDYAMKANQLRSEVPSLADRLTVRWGSTGKAEQPKGMNSMRVRP